MMSEFSGCFGTAPSSYVRNLSAALNRRFLPSLSFAKAEAIRHFPKNVKNLLRPPYTLVPIGVKVAVKVYTLLSFLE